MKGTLYIVVLFCVISEEFKKRVVQWQMGASNNICSIFFFNPLGFSWRVTLCVATLGHLTRLETTAAKEIVILIQQIFDAFCNQEEGPFLGSKMKSRPLPFLRHFYHGKVTNSTVKCHWFAISFSFTRPNMLSWGIRVQRSKMSQDQESIPQKE